MPLATAIAEDGSKGLLARIGGFLHDVTTGEWVRAQRVNLKTGEVETRFGNGVTVTERPGAAPTGTVPARWLARTDGNLTQLREGSWVQQESLNVRTGAIDRTFGNGIRVQTAPGQSPLVTVPPRLLSGGPGRI